MLFVADLHIHSRFSISTSRDLVPERLDSAARLKGITLLGTGDCTHPGWRAELAEKLVPAEPGLYRLAPRFHLPSGRDEAPVRFLLTAEISSIYRFDGRVRKVHSLVLLPALEDAERLSQALGRIGNLAADGRPVLALDARDLLEIVLDCSPEAMLVPAHIWTPWFSVLGARSGFDSVEDCFRDLAGHVRAVETGLSSDPPMNWRCGRLDRYTLLSNSDAHSPDRLGREANILETELSYASVARALREGAAAGLRGTIEFFPEEGKYHLDGHRACGVRQDPELTRSTGARCPVCGKAITVGVLHRVLELADRPEGRRPPGAPPFHSLVPLRELIAEIAGAGAQTKGVSRAYAAVLERCGTELGLLLELPIAEVARCGGELLGEAVRRMRSREVFAEAGYDGEYGTIRLFRPGEIRERSQSFLLPGLAPEERGEPTTPRARPLFPAAQRELFDDAPEAIVPARGRGLTDEQRKAASHGRGPALVIAGPGTGKTRVLAYRVAHLVQELAVEPERILVVTFTNRAAREIAGRLGSLLGPAPARRLRAGTFHSFGLEVLSADPERWGRPREFALYDDRDRTALLASLGASAAAAAERSAAVAAIKQGAREPEAEEAAVLEAYERELRARGAFDLDDLVRLPAASPEALPVGLEWLLVDELQDTNPAQYRLIRALAPSADANLFAIGDPDQSIYGFRGGDPSLARRLLEDYPGARLYELGTSYRCPRSFLRASHRVLKGSAGKPLEGIEEGIRVRVVAAPTERSEAELIARSIDEMMGGLRFFSMDSAVSRGEEAPGVQGLGDFAVLVRMSRLAEPIGAALDDHAIPFQLAGERSLLEEEPCRSILDLLALGARPADRSLERRFRGRLSSPAAAAAAVAAAGSVADRIGAAASLLEVDARSAREALGRLSEMARPWGEDCAGFLRRARLGSPADDLLPGAERVSVMTMHAAKGLEFPCVFIAGCEDGLVPLDLEAFGLRADPGEERRLLYVGMTRASRLLVLTHARRRRLFGRSVALPRSRFLSGIDGESFQEEELELPRHAERAEPQLELDLEARE